jgi:biopolymer transport protein ExbD
VKISAVGSSTGILPVFRAHGQDARATQGNQPQPRSSAAQRGIQHEIRSIPEERISKWILRFLQNDRQKLSLKILPSQNPMNETLHVPPAKKARFEITPLMAILFVLLATFVLSAAFLKRQVSIEHNLNSEGEWNRGKNETVSIQASDAGTFYWKQGTSAPAERITAAELSERLAAYKRTAREPGVVILTDKHATFGSSVLVLDEVRKAGIEKVSFESHVSRTGQ